MKIPLGGHFILPNMTLILFLLSNIRAERPESQLRQLEALLAKGDTHNGHAPQKSRDKKRQRIFPAKYQYPYKIGDRVPAELTVDHFTKRPNHQTGNFKALFAKGNADERNTKQNARQRPGQPCPKSRKNKP